MDKRQILIDQCTEEIKTAIQELKNITDIYNNSVNNTYQAANFGSIQNFQYKVNRTNNYYTLAELLKFVNEANTKLQNLYNEYEHIKYCSDMEVNRLYKLHTHLKNNDIISYMLELAEQQKEAII